MDKPFEILRNTRKFLLDYIADLTVDELNEEKFSAAEIATIKELFFSTIELFESDYREGLFSNYTPWTNRYGVALNTIDEVLAFLPYHEGLHLGYVMALKRIVMGGRV